MNHNAASMATAAIGHLIGVTVVGCLVGWATLGEAAGPVISAVWSGNIVGSALPTIGLHLLLSSVLWASIFVVVKRAMRKEDSGERRVIKLHRGTALTEFLIILAPFLLLTSGLSQLAILNTSSLLADVAIFNASRAVWVWDVREDADRPLTIRKARTAAALALAPSAPSDFVTDQVTDGQLKDLVEELGGTGGAVGGVDAERQSLFYNVAYDTGTFGDRITKKVYFAYLATEVEFRYTEVETPEERQVPAVETNFTYQMNMVFPWFAYIWGERRNVGGRVGYYAPIRRIHTMPEQLRQVEP